MIFIQPKVEPIVQGPGKEGIFKQIEIAGRTCYFSQDKITDESCYRFVDRMISSGHLAMLEHGTVYLTVTYDDRIDEIRTKKFNDIVVSHYANNKYSKVTYANDRNTYITTNYRVIVENGWEDDLKYLSEPTEYHEKRLTFRFTTQVAITREANRHRVNSMAERSTRFCNFSKGKFDSQIQISIPHFTNEDEINNTLHKVFPVGYECRMSEFAVQVKRKYCPCIFWCHSTVK